jgi:leucyl-tRNA synthetase
VLYPIGYDAFGLPTENYAIKTGIHPAKVTHDNITAFAASCSGSATPSIIRARSTPPIRVIISGRSGSSQVLQKGLAYKAEIPINFCTSCKVGLANEEVVDGVCERCGGEVVRMVRSQWMLKITEYAQRLIDDLSTVDYLDKIKAQQINWIGRSEGALVNFTIAGTGDLLTVYTTRPDTLFGATYMVVSPEHPMIEQYADRITNLDDVRAYQKAAAIKSDFERSELVKDKTGVPLGEFMRLTP